jgi:hypothetical protein
MVSAGAMRGTALSAFVAVMPFWEYSLILKNDFSRLLVMCPE